MKLAEKSVEERAQRIPEIKAWVEKYGTTPFNMLPLVVTAAGAVSPMQILAWCYDLAIDVPDLLADLKAAKFAEREWHDKALELITERQVTPNRPTD